MRKLFYFLLFTFYFTAAQAQTPKTYTSSEILLQLKKLNVVGSVLYIAAHPDDENTRLLAYLANERLYRTGYLSLTRGDGGQNLIGDEQGIDLGLIRTQELLSARRIDGAEQFFSRAYDFGFCKNPEEALKTWNHDKILSDVVWVIRKFRPDVIITRFPEDSRAGHGHHSASAILAREAFTAAADATKFPEQLAQGVTVWQAKRILWNTYNFGGNNTQSEDQLKIDCGGYNPLLGKSYGEIAALSRSQHKSQGFGVPAQRGESIEYFATVNGDKPTKDLMDGVDVSWARTNNGAITNAVNNIIQQFSSEHPEQSVPALVKLYQLVKTIDDSYWKMQKLKEIQNLIQECSGLFLEATTNTPYAVQGDSLKVDLTINDRLDTSIKNASIHMQNGSIHMHDTYYVVKDITKDENKTLSLFIQPQGLTQPYWLVEPMEKGSFNVSYQQLIGEPENAPLSIPCMVNIYGERFTFEMPIHYKYTDPIRGEVYQPIEIYPPIIIEDAPTVGVFSSLDVSYNIKYKALRDVSGIYLSKYNKEPMKKDEERNYLHYSNLEIKGSQSNYPGFSFSDTLVLSNGEVAVHPVTISYNHIPAIVYFKPYAKVITEVNLKKTGKSIGYITGAGDKVPAALEQMGYKVTMLKENDITVNNLKQFDAIVTGVRAYNINEWLNNRYDTLMQYIKDGGTLLVQYNTNNSLGPIKAKIGPYPFTVTNKRITDETAKVNFLLPNDAALNYPNKITNNDFSDWIQERSIYDVENTDSNYKCIFSMSDPNETPQDGSLLIANYGKGKFVYTGLVFFRELPAGVPGAYRLFANLLAKRTD